jgi:hypothetical protein
MLEKQKAAALPTLFLTPRLFITANPPLRCFAIPAYLRLA